MISFIVNNQFNLKPFIIKSDFYKGFRLNKVFDIPQEDFTLLCKNLNNNSLNYFIGEKIEISANTYYSDYLIYRSEIINQFNVNLRLSSLLRNKIANIFIEIEGQDNPISLIKKLFITYPVIESFFNDGNLSYIWSILNQYNLEVSVNYSGFLLDFLNDILKLCLLNAFIWDNQIILNPFLKKLNLFTNIENYIYNYTIEDSDEYIFNNYEVNDITDTSEFIVSRERFGENKITVPSIFTVPSLYTSFWQNYYRNICINFQYPLKKLKFSMPNFFVDIFSSYQIFDYICDIISIEIYENYLNMEMLEKR